MATAVILPAYPSYAVKRDLRPDHRCFTGVVESVEIEVESCRRDMYLQTKKLRSAALYRTTRWRPARKKIVTACAP